MEEEFRLHIEMETERLMRTEQLMHNEARRRALVSFGGVENHKEELRSGRGFAWLNGLTLDLTLGVRMLRKYPGLTITGIVGMGMAVAIGATTFTMIELSTRPHIPLPEGDRLVAVRLWHARANRPVDSKPFEYFTWRELQSLREVAAFRMTRRNLTLPNAIAEPVDVAEMSAAAFDVSRVRPLRGRYLEPGDERVGAEHVVVIGFDLWQTKLRADSMIVGKQLRLGSVAHTIVGVMPKGFAMPLDHQVWTPLRLEASIAPGIGRELFVFGRLADGITSGSARSEVEARMRIVQSAYPAEYANVEARLVPYAMLFDNSTDVNQPWAFFSIQGLLSMILVLIAINVAALVYARTATRRGEIAVRLSLGASSRRIVGQLFAEALVLATVASSVGLAVAFVAFRLAHNALAKSGSGMPFWWEPRITLGTVLYVAGLALLAAFIIGVIPTRSAVAANVRTTLNELTCGTTLRLPKAWTVLIVAQVAVAVVVLPAIVHLSAVYIWHSFIAPGFDADKYLSARIEFTDDMQPTGVAARLPTLEERLEAVPNVTAVTYSAHTPGFEPEHYLDVEHGSQKVWRARMTEVATDYFATFNVAIRRGRGFHSGDLLGEATGIIVNESFVREVFAGGNGVGQRVRIHRWESDSGPAHPWLEVVGVVPDFPPNKLNPVLTDARVYRPLLPHSAESAMISLRMSTEPIAFGDGLRRIASAVDPDMQLREIMPLDAVYTKGNRAMGRLAGIAMALVALSVIALSAAGMYSLMSFTVTRRRREIGIRSALGANPLRVLGSVMARATYQLALGCAAGLAVAVVLAKLGDEYVGQYGLIVVPSVLALMLLTGLLAAWGPARRGLRIRPSEALKAE